MSCALEVLNPTGHLSLIWDPDDPEQVERVQAEVERLRAAGYRFFAVLNPEVVKVAGGRLDVIHVDDPTAPLEPPKEVTEEAKKDINGFKPGTTFDWEPNASGGTVDKTDPVEEPSQKGPCQGTTAAGKPCKRPASATGFCGAHQPDGKKAKAKPKGKPPEKTVAVRQLRGG